MSVSFAALWYFIILLTAAILGRSGSWMSKVWFAKIVTAQLKLTQVENDKMIGRIPHNQPPKKL